MIFDVEILGGDQPSVKLGELYVRFADEDLPASLLTGNRVRMSLGGGSNQINPFKGERIELPVSLYRNQLLAASIMVESKKEPWKLLEGVLDVDLYAEYIDGDWGRLVKLRVVKGFWYSEPKPGEYRTLTPRRVEPTKDPYAWKKSFPKKHSQGDDIRGSSGWHMATHVTLDADGKLKGTCRTWCNHKIKGFTGSVIVSLWQRDLVPTSTWFGDEYYPTRCIWRSDVKTYGVASKWFGSPNDRTESVAWTVPAKIVAHTSFIKIHHFRNEPPFPQRLMETMRAFGIEKVVVPIIRHKW